MLVLVRSDLDLLKASGFTGFCRVEGINPQRAQAPNPKP